MDYDYNTSRKKLVLPEYGRHIQKMVDHAKAIKDREERNKAAKTIISIMGNMNPHLRDISDFKHKLWDHLALMSDFELDIDSPYEMPARETLISKPKQIPYMSDKIRYLHYGRIMQQMIDAAVEMEDGSDKERLTMLIANHMKKSYLTWNRNQVTDEIIFHDIRQLSGGKIIIPENMKLSETKDILAKSKKKRPPKKK
ncbi:MAG: DUF4290 domain-containing protein [Bacteroidales bacterium]|nr:MAG: DUF4290 domain-containing protein [Bacteroidales bacterium]